MKKTENKVVVKILVLIPNQNHFLLFIYFCIEQGSHFEKLQSVHNCSIIVAPRPQHYYLLHHALYLLNHCINNRDFTIPYSFTSNILDCVQSCSHNAIATFLQDRALLAAILQIHLKTKQKSLVISQNSTMNYFLAYSLTFCILFYLSPFLVLPHVVRMYNASMTNKINKFHLMDEYQNQENKIPTVTCITHQLVVKIKIMGTYTQRSNSYPHPQFTPNTKSPSESQMVQSIKIEIMGTHQNQNFLSFNSSHLIQSHLLNIEWIKLIILRY